MSATKKVLFHFLVARLPQSFYLFGSSGALTPPCRVFFFFFFSRRLDTFAFFYSRFTKIINYCAKERGFARVVAESILFNHVGEFELAYEQYTSQRRK